MEDIIDTNEERNPSSLRSLVYVRGDKDSQEGTHTQTYTHSTSVCD